METSSNTIPLYFYFMNDICHVSIEIGGNYKRGYRRFIGDSPLRETLAAAACYASLSSLSTPVPLVDPFCGSGTILGEWVSFLEEDFPYIQQKRFHMKSNVVANEYYKDCSLQRSSPPITSYTVFGNDISDKAIEAATKNFELLHPQLGKVVLDCHSFHNYKTIVQTRIKSPIAVVTNVMISLDIDI